MKASERSFSFIATECYYEVPFFQRNYVWEYSNWEELINNLMDPSKCTFLGSIILKQKVTRSGEISRFTIIDGQQRLTTLSILMRACYDELFAYRDKFSDEVNKRTDSDLFAHLFVIPDTFSDEKEVKIHHSHIDRPSFEKVINGEYSSQEKLDTIILKDEKSTDDKQIECKDKILLCYKYFRKALSKHDISELKNLWKILTKEEVKFLVNIDLDANENEQAIFDAVNSSGVRLTSSDTIKNALFQRYIDILKNSMTSEQAETFAIKLYSEKWEKVFLATSEDAEYWATQHQSGRLYRDNIEILLHCVAVIEGFFDPAQTKMSDLAQCYKEHIAVMNADETKVFISKISDYARLYKENIVNMDVTNLYGFDNYFLRLVHVCDVLEVSTFYPYILSLLYKNEKVPDEVTLKTKCAELGRYLVLHAICNATTKNYNKECVQFLNGESPDSLLKNCDDINEQTFNAGLRELWSNKLATLLLFWIELYKRANDKTELKELKYTFTLEHIMPQRWNEYWGIDKLPVVDYDGNIVQDEVKANEIRGKAVYNIGNMTLLNSNLNTSLRNYDFKRKVEGEGKKKGMKLLGDCFITKEILNKQVWDEKQIYERTIEFASCIKIIWNIKFN